MNYEDPQLLDRLASEYVLGTLRGPARRRFERILDESDMARQAVARWQESFSDLAQSLPTVTPSAGVWRAIEAKINPAMPTARTSFWRRWALVTTTALVIMAVMVTQRPPPIPPTDQQVAFVNADNLTPLWVISMDFSTGQLSTRAVSATADQLDKVYELWMLPQQGNPRSLGLMPVNGDATRQTFSPALLDLLRSAQGLAVSIEPAGGSPTGLPTGPVVYQASLLSL